MGFENKNWGDLATLEYGKRLKGYKYGEGSVPVYGTNGKVGYTDENPLFNDSGVIIGRKGAYRGVHYSDSSFYVIDTAFYLKPKGEIELDLKWAYYELLTKDINSMDSGSAIPSTSRNDFYALPVNLPSLKEQRSVVNILGQLDEKIGLNNQINKNLEEMAQAIFKRWFVDFEFPNENGDPYKSSGGEFEESDLGLIPKGWEIKSLKDISLEIVCGKTPSTKVKENYGGIMPFITIPDMHKNIFVTNTEKMLSEKGIESQKKKVVPAHSVCVSCIATPGLVSLTSEPSQTNQQINTVICSKESSYYLFLQLKNMSSQIRDLGSGGSTTLNLNKTEFSKIKIIFPTMRLIYAFYNIADSLFQRILSNQKENEILQQIRDSLLPKLMSGEIRVPMNEEDAKESRKDEIPFG